jgi:hypothetical protein
MSSIGQSICDQVGCTIQQLDDWLQSAPDPSGHDAAWTMALAIVDWSIASGVNVWADRRGVNAKVASLVLPLMPDGRLPDWLPRCQHTVYLHYFN